ncbi:hypothetical protein [Citrobacter meridianamericanus]|uniref:hypothetical protein n=1 Tax=Citrobacter meridianamericanus TaxID=2894201 RepID=UPI00351D720C
MRSEEHVRLLSVLRYQQSYRDGQPDGVARYFSEEGALIRKEQWSHGQLHGECGSF